MNAAPLDAGGNGLALHASPAPGLSGDGCAPGQSGDGHAPGKSGDGHAAGKCRDGCAASGNGSGGAAEAPQLGSQSKRGILRARAALLARESARGGGSEAEMAVFEFLLGSQRFAVEAASIREVFSIRNCAPVPCAPEYVAGLANVRGEVLWTVDLRPSFGIQKAETAGPLRVVILSHDGMHLGVLIDSVVGSGRIPLAGIQASPAYLAGAGGEYVRGVACGSLTVLDAVRIVLDKKLVMQDGSAGQEELTGEGEEVAGGNGDVGAGISPQFAADI